MLLPAKLGPTGLWMEWKLPMMINNTCSLQVERGAIPTGALKTTLISSWELKINNGVALLNRSTALLLSARA
ncbi:hypothetical protein HU200_030835 [Digitaria exilis]|uniref:Uncharacterized protein n=1 Tax=Digitaria exilis TaxID=1010633 RepID=A0A835BRA9_9POAL|nr:hypothetical protein HU200_030835 [Digitaria exilis]